MNDKIFKYIKILSYVLLGLGAASLIYFLVASATQTELDPTYTTVDATVGAAKGAGVMLTYAYITLAIAIVLVLLFPLINIIKNPKGAKNILIALGIMVVLFGGGYLLGDTTPIENVADGGYWDNKFTLKITDMGLYAAYLLMAVAFVVIIYGEVKSSLMKNK